MRTRSPVSTPLHARFGLKPDGGWADVAMRDLATLEESARQHWVKLFNHWAAVAPRSPAKDWNDAQGGAQTACLTAPMDGVPEFGRAKPGSDEFRQYLAQAGPAEQWLNEVDVLVGGIGEDAVAAALAKWLAAATTSSIGQLNRNCPNREILRAMIWTVTRVPAAACVDALRQLCAFATNHNTAQGITIAMVLARIASEDALAALRLLRQAAKRPTPRTRFTRAAEHVEASLGINADDAAERFVPTYGLDAGGCRRIDVGGATAVLRLGAVGVAIEWLHADGRPIRSPPAAVARQHAAQIKDAKATARSINQMLLAQRDRLDGLMWRKRTWDLAAFRTRYLDHVLVGHIARRLIWIADDIPVLFVDGQATDVAGERVAATGQTKIALWHPIGRTTDEVVAWRDRLAAMQITQPFKQAYREIYLLTDAERATASYSNRFAAHILRQHQFAQLARMRGWNYSLTGIWDGGDRSDATFNVPESDLRVELWLGCEGELDHDARSGIARYVCSDQIRFYRGDEKAPMPLVDVGSLIFSEVMRDVDLFVGVASVGNDPEWRDGGPGGRYRMYWHSYSFGELSETAKTRKAALARIVPRLKIAPRCTVDDKFLIVRGDLRTYQIHLGSGNILMEPNDHYLCIVTDRKAEMGDVLLPFEGDSTLSLILSKAFLLAADGKITDPTIARQIGGPC